LLRCLTPQSAVTAEIDVAPIRQETTPCGRSNFSEADSQPGKLPRVAKAAEPAGI